ncbi:MAG: hypothetical protein IKS48_00310 [Eubacterium sp.]|nr:hypothetical protein [Eubacterium sp.]
MKWFGLIAEALICVVLITGFVIFYHAKDTHNMCFFGILSVIAVSNYKDYVKEFVP